MLSSHGQQLQGKAKKQFQDFFPNVNSESMSGNSSGGQRAITVISAPPEITPEQQERGWRGEEEVRNRLSLPGGYGGFIFISDKRKEGCGYDFLCMKNNIEVKLEVKTFTQNGRITMTSREIKEALLCVDNYFLVGVMASDRQAAEWLVSFKQNPIGDLLEKGEFDIQTKLHVTADKIFQLPVSMI
jgi:hypothetical protein